MRIGVDARLLMDRSGTGMRSFLYHLLDELWRMDHENEYFLYATGPLHLPFDPKSSSRWHVRVGSGPLARVNLLWLQTGLNLQARRDRIDVFLGPRHALPYFLKLFRPGARLAVVLFDANPVYVPGTTPLKTWLYNTAMFFLSAWLSDRVITTSESSRADLVRLARLSPDKIHVAYGAANAEIFFPRPRPEAAAFLKEKFGINKPFVLSGDVYNPRKNFASVLEAYDALPAELKERFDLVGTGSPARFYPSFPLDDLIRRKGLQDRVRLVGLVNHLEMPYFYAGASLFLYPSLYEGFGLPIVEAMSCGCPVATSNVSSMPEAAGDAAVLVSPGDVGALRGAMMDILPNPSRAAAMARAGLENARRFSWNRYAREVLDACLSVKGPRA
ncbi:MAG: glycosyltransferase family 4 protein [Elusimicrobiota bacterium]